MNEEAGGIVMADGRQEWILGLDGDAVALEVLDEVEGDWLGGHLGAVPDLGVEGKVCFVHLFLRALPAAPFLKPGNLGLVRVFKVVQILVENLCFFELPLRKSIQLIVLGDNSVLLHDRLVVSLRSIWLCLLHWRSTIFLLRRVLHNCCLAPFLLLHHRLGISVGGTRTCLFLHSKRGAESLVELYLNWCCVDDISWPRLFSLSLVNFADEFEVALLVDNVLYLFCLLIPNYVLAALLEAVHDVHIVYSLLQFQPLQLLLAFITSEVLFFLLGDGVL